MPIKGLGHKAIRKHFVLILIEVPCSDANQSTLLTDRKLCFVLFDFLQFGPIEVMLRCQSKDFAKIPIEGHCYNVNRKVLVKLPIEGHCYNADQRYLLKLQ